MQAHTGLATSNASANNGEDVEKMTLNGSGRSKFETKKSLAIDEVCVAMFWPTPGFKGRAFDGYVSAEWTLISASAVARCEK